MSKKVNMVEEVAVDVVPEVTVNESVDVVPEVTEQPKVEVETKKASKENSEFERLVKETIRGVHGSGRERMLSLGNQYVKVQQEVNRRSR